MMTTGILGTMPVKKKRGREGDLLSEESKLEKSFKKAFGHVPMEPGANIKPRRRTSTTLEVEERYRLLKRRVRKKLGDRFIETQVGRDKYLTGGIYAVAGKYKVKGDLLDWDHELRNVEVKLDAKVRLNLMIHLARRLKVRT